MRHHLEQGHTNRGGDHDMNHERRSGADPDTARSAVWRHHQAGEHRLVRELTDEDHREHPNNNCDDLLTSPDEDRRRSPVTGQVA